MQLGVYSVLLELGWARLVGTQPWLAYLYSLSL